jgi:hypothetical protein
MNGTPVDFFLYIVLTICHGKGEVRGEKVERKKDGKLKN